MKYRKKPVVIEAFQWGQTQLADYPQWAKDVLGHEQEPHVFSRNGKPLLILADGHMRVRTLEGEMRAEIDDWIIQGIKGEIYPCKPDIFAATYDPVDAA